MKIILVLFVGVVLVGTAWCRYTRYPSGVQVWVQKVKVFEVSESGEIINPEPDNNDVDDSSDIDVRFGSIVPMNYMPVWVQNVPATRIFTQRVYPSQYRNGQFQY
ncbi:hypothetical protein HF086_013621 [Spodoptera exigua]|uniref:Uncharacterized protein n=1 Tax=Spodoptera exigua TaxID=7107 RepID=A0A922MDV7_SPOEX|nr:hypothetical protein HF086_013621 [Spodoptera exigua]